MSLSESIAEFREVAVGRGEIWGSELTAIARYGCQALEPLVPLHMDDNADVRHAAVDVLDLWQEDERIVPPLIRALQDPSQSVRAMAASRLGGTGHIGAVGPLVAALTDQYTYTRRNAASSLGRLGDPRGIDAVAEMLKHETDAGVRDHAAFVLSDIGAFQCLRDAMRQGIELKTSVVAKALVHTHDDSASAFLVGLSASDRSPGDKAKAASLMGKLGDPHAIPYLQAMTQDEAWHVRLSAGRALMELGDDAGISTLIALLESLDYGARAAAAPYLGGSGDVRAIEPLLGMMQSGIEGDRLHAASALGKTNDPRAIAPLIDALRDDIASGAGALSRFDDPRAVQALIEALRSTALPVRMQAVTALSHFGGSVAVEPLIEAFRDAEPCIRDLAAESLGMIGDSRATEVLREALGIPDAYLRRIAAWALTRMGTPEAETALLEVLAGNDTDAISGAYSFFIAKGIPDSEGALLAALTCHGHRAAAEDYAGSGNAVLADAGRTWLSNHPHVKYRGRRPWSEPTAVRWQASRSAM